MASRTEIRDQIHEVGERDDLSVSEHWCWHNFIGEQVLNLYLLLHISEAQMTRRQIQLDWSCYTPVILTLVPRSVLTEKRTLQFGRNYFYWFLLKQIQELNGMSTNPECHSSNCQVSSLHILYADCCDFPKIVYVINAGDVAIIKF